MVRNSPKLVIIFLVGLYSSASFSNVNKDLVVSLSVGPGWVKAGQTQTIQLTSDTQKTYFAHKSSQALVNGALFFGLQKPISCSIQSQIGIDFGITGNANLSGDIWDDADPAFDNYTYQYQVRHRHIAIKGKLIDQSFDVHPWISAAAGVGFNYSHSFINTPKIFEAVAMPNFSSKMVSAFTYSVGIGLQRTLSKHLQVGIGYEFADWGKSNLGSSEGQTTGQSLSLPHQYIQSLLLNVTYGA